MSSRLAHISTIRQVSVGAQVLVGEGRVPPLIPSNAPQGWDKEAAPSLKGDLRRPSPWLCLRESGASQLPPMPFASFMGLPCPGRALPRPLSISHQHRVPSSAWLFPDCRTNQGHGPRSPGESPFLSAGPPFLYLQNPQIYYNGQNSLSSQIF